jgi:hypothetical protein
LKHSLCAGHRGEAKEYDCGKLKKLDRRVHRRT